MLEKCICGCETEEHHLTRRLRLKLQKLGYIVFNIEFCEHRFDVVAVCSHRCENQVTDDIRSITGVKFKYEIVYNYNKTRVTCQVLI